MCQYEQFYKSKGFFLNLNTRIINTMKYFWGGVLGLYTKLQCHRKISDSSTKQLKITNTESIKDSSMFSEIVCQCKVYIQLIYALIKSYSNLNAESSAICNTLKI